VDLPVILRDEILDPVLTLHEDCQRRRLDSAHRRQVKPARLRVERRHRPRAVDADQPIRFRTAHRRIRQRQHGRIIAQVHEALLDGGGRHGLQPKALDALLGLGVLHYVTENQLPLPPGVAGIDQRVHVRALDQLEQHLEPRFVPFDRPQVEVGRDDRQVSERPLAALDLELLRYAQLQQMADRGGKHVMLALVVVVQLLEPAQRFGDVARDRRLLGND